MTKAIPSSFVTNSAARPCTREHAVLRAVWLKAYREGEVILTFPTVTEAKRIRFQLYNALRITKANPEQHPELALAAAECSLVIDGSTLRVTKKLYGPLAAIAQQIGFDQEATTQPGEPTSEAEEALNKLLAELGMEKPPAAPPAPTSQLPEPSERPANPYYKREE